MHTDTDIDIPLHDWTRRRIATRRVTATALLVVAAIAGAVLVVLT